MEDAVPRLVAALDETGLRPALSRPLRCHWLAANDRAALGEAAALGARLAADASTTPVVLLCASGDPTGAACGDGLVQRGGWSYVPGAADDHSTWARGLTEELFWAHAAWLTDPLATLLEIEDRVATVVCSGHDAQSPATVGGGAASAPEGQQRTGGGGGVEAAGARRVLGDGHKAPRRIAVRGLPPLWLGVSPEALVRAACRSAETTVAPAPASASSEEAEEKAEGAIRPPLEVIEILLPSFRKAAANGAAGATRPTTTDGEGSGGGISGGRRMAPQQQLFIDPAAKHDIERSLHLLFDAVRRMSRSAALGAEQPPLPSTSSAAPDGGLGIACADPTVACACAVALVAKFGVRDGSGGGGEVDKKRLQWAQRLVASLVDGSMFPSRSHMKQLSRYFLSPRVFGRNMYTDDSSSEEGGNESHARGTSGHAFPQPLV